MKNFSIFLIPLIFFSNFIALTLFSTYSTGASIAYFKYSVAIIFVPVFLYSLFKARYLTQIIRDPIAYIAALTIFAILVSFNNSPLNVSNVLQNLQFCLIIFAAYYTGWALSKITNESYLIIVKTTLAISFIAVIFGFIELTFGEIVWSGFNLEAYFRLVMGFDAPLDPLQGLPRSWISWDLAGLTGNPVRRMVSFFVEPVGFGRFIALCLLLSFLLYLKNIISTRKIILSALIFGMCLILSLSKGGILLVLTFMFGWLFGVRLLLAITLTVSVMLVMLLVSGNAQILGPSVINHLSSVVHINQIVNAKPLGLGINVNDVEIVRRLVVNTNDEVEDKSEGGLALYVILFGYLGLLIYSSFIYTFYKKITNASSVDEKFFSLFALCIMITGVFAHSAFSLIGSGIPLIILGYLNGKK